MNRAFYILCALLSVSILLPLSGTEEELTEIDENDMFSDDMFSDDMFSDDDASDTGEPDVHDGEELFDQDMVEEYEKEELDSGIDTLLLKSETLEWGGRFQFSIAPSWSWHNSELDLEYIIDNRTSPDSSILATTLEATLFFDARPDEDFRVFGKTDINAPFEPEGKWNMEDIINIQELFADFNYMNRIFFRAGKQTIQWGVGYFFSPADIVNLTPIDPEEPELEREGPVALKAHIPIDIHNLYIYLITEQEMTPDEIIIASQFEFVTGTLETTIGGLLQYDHPLSGILLLSYPVISFVDLFCEGMILSGSDKMYIKKTDNLGMYPTGFMVEDRSDEIFFSGTIGVLFSIDQINSEWETVSMAAQYYFNGQGYNDPDTNAVLFSLYLSDNIPLEDVLNPGMHYGAGTISWAHILDSDFTTSLFWIGNLTDGSGQIMPSFTWNPFDYARFTLSMPFFYGDVFDEFTFPFGGRSFTIKFDATFGSGNF